MVPVRGRPALRWLGDLLLFQVGVLTGWSVFQSRAATGTPGPAAEPDLPGVLTRLRFPDGPVFSDRGRICLIHDTAEGRWGATAQLTHTGTGMLSAAECDQLAARLGSLLSSIGHREVVDRLSLYVRTVPDDATEYQMWRARHDPPRRAGAGPAAPPPSSTPPSARSACAPSCSSACPAARTCCAARPRPPAAVSPAAPWRSTARWTASRTASNRSACGR